jgi:hypothetical protein
LTENGNGTPEPTDGILPPPPPAPQPPPPRMSSRARNTLIGGATASAVAAVVLLIVFTGHHGSDREQGQAQTFTVPAMTFNLQASAKAVLDASDVVGCSFAEDALTTAANVVGKDIDNPSAAVADAQKAISQAGDAAVMARTPALRRAVAQLKVHLTALRDSAQVNDPGQEASALLPIQDDMQAVFGACPQ